MTLFSFEICAGGGGQALGLETAGFEPAALVEIDHHCCNTLRLNRPHWEVLENDIKHVNGKAYQGVDLLSGGVPCPPFSKAGKQLGGQDERDLFPEALRLTDEIRPKAVMLENVRGFLDAVFEDYRIHLKKQFEKMGYVADWRLMNASDYGVSQLRPRVVVIALRKEYANSFSWPTASQRNPKSVGALLKDLMMDRGWPGPREQTILPRQSWVDPKNMEARTWARPAPKKPGRHSVSTAKAWLIYRQIETL
jgi:DNA (cytosine-5)-methyltransferase 1